jgi:hypothetical protein
MNPSTTSNCHRFYYNLDVLSKLPLLDNRQTANPSLKPCKQPL